MESFRDYNRSSLNRDSGFNFTGDEGQRSTVVHAIHSFLPLLQICLKRHCYNIQLKRMEKVTDFLEYPETLTSSPFSLPERTGRSRVSIDLSASSRMGVVPRIGRIAYVHPTADGPFFRFHDGQVTPATMEEDLYATMEEIAVT
ncbi:hypothetical protein BDW75DRAFT_208909 [Aspergillus navahoensis]